MRTRQSLSSYFAAISPSATVRSAYTTFYNSLITANVYPKLAILYPCVLDTEAASRINAITPGAGTLTDEGTAPTWVSGVGGAGGFTANGAALSTGFSWASSIGFGGVAGMSLNSVCCLFDSATSGTGANADFGISTLIFGRCRLAGDIIQGRINDGTNETIATGVTDGSGLFGFERSSVTNKEVFRNGVSIGAVSRNSGTGSANVLKMLGNGTSTGVRRCRLFAAGASLGAQGQLDFFNAWTQFKTDIGCT